MEGQLSKSTINQGLGRGDRANGDIIPWNIAQQYQDEDFPSLNGARIVRIATHPEYQGVIYPVILYLVMSFLIVILSIFQMGYGKRAIEILKQYYKGEIPYTGQHVLEQKDNIVAVDDEEVDLLEETIGKYMRTNKLIIYEKCNRFTKNLYLCKSIYHD